MKLKRLFVPFLWGICSAAMSVSAADHQLLNASWKPAGNMQIKRSDQGNLIVSCLGKYASTTVLPLKVKASEYNCLLLRVRSDKPGKLHLLGYFSRKDAPGLAESRRIDGYFDLKPGWNDLMVDLRSEEEWKNDISGIRLDFSVPTTQTLEISRLAFSFIKDGSAQSYSLLNRPTIPQGKACRILAGGNGKLKVKVDAKYTGVIIQNLDIFARDYNRLRFRVKGSEADYIGFAGYYSRKDAPGYAEARKIYTRRSVDKNYTEVTVDLSGDKQWKGVVNSLRLDFSVSKPGISLEIDQLEFFYSDQLPPWAPGACMADFKSHGDGFSFRLNDTDSQTAWQKVDVNAAEYPYLRLKLRGEEIFTGGISIYFTRSDSANPGSDKWIKRQYFSVSPKSCYVYLNMRESAGYKGKITGIRLDFTGNPGKKYIVEEVSFQKEFDLLAVYPSHCLPLEVDVRYDLHGEGKSRLHFFDEEYRELPQLAMDITLPAQVVKPVGAVLLAVDKNVKAVVRAGSYSPWKALWVAHPEFADKGGFSYVGKKFTLSKPVSGKIQMTADDQYALRINGKFVCHRGYWGFPLVMDITSFLRDGENEIEVECDNHGGPGGVLFHGYFKSADGKITELLSDASWTCSKRPGKRDLAVKVIGNVPLNPWGALPYTDLSSDAPLKEEAFAKSNEKIPPYAGTPKRVKYDVVFKNGQNIITADGKPLFFNGFQGLGLRTLRQMQNFLDNGVEFINANGITSQGYASGSVANFWKGPDEYDWDMIERGMAKYLKMNPNVKIIFGIGIDAPKWWADANPDERVLLAGDKHPHALSSPASMKLRRDVGKMLRATINYLENSRYADNIAGYRLASQCDGGEFQYLGGWIGKYADYSPAMQSYFRNYLREKYQNDLNALRKAWNDPKVTFDTASVPSVDLRSRCENGVLRDYTGDAACVKDYIDCQNHCLATWAISALQNARQAAPDKLLSIYGGYVLCYEGFQLLNNAHLKFGDIFDSGLLNIVTTPQDYNMRAPGSPNGCHIPHTSLKLRGIKLVSEQDSRTHLGFRQSNTYSLNLDEDLQLMKRNFIWNLCNDGGLYFYDMAEVWFTAPEMHKLGGKLQRIGNASLNFGGIIPNQVALLYSAESINMLSIDSIALTKTVTRHLRENLARSGVPYDAYLLHDILRDDFPADNYRCIIIANGFALSEKERAAIRSKFCKDGKTVIFGYAPGAFKNDRIDEPAMKALTGIDISVSSTSLALQMRIGDEVSGAMPSVRPSFRIKPSDGVEVLGRYLADGTAAFARKKFPDYTSVVSLVPQMSQKSLNQLLKEAGCHTYVDNGEAIFANGRFVGIHAACDGKKVIKLPCKTNVYDVFRDCQVGENTDKITTEMRKLETNLYFLGTAEEWKEFRKSL